MSDALRVYEIRFNGRPTIDLIQRELERAAKSMNQYSKVEIWGNGSVDPDREEITFQIVNDS